ncbi:uncharacterized protein BP01DRAFT_346540 [Aspergillus saccharolyticus JOP 1030-1]|uniref:Uncharacterized protein n=1 Tax=Aspergillus saccharolyticus JOP 1030-1 TaxID=1450539 RepID=A0A318Z8C0_9EURO|nr:hypothetical protein BP01DRAFT_346540 [Aspergillus saccharolyticus JOP 1030-1]PYH42644.1 hypothetical protein BP01DRAFT_346540 [Aspergillus saccharolyticus JOP 1030-1]
MAPRPALYPLKTPKGVTFPSELQDDLPFGSEINQQDAGDGPSVLPPQAYTDFLRALSPVYAGSEGLNASYTKWMMSKTLPSPVSLPSTASTSSFPGDGEAKTSPTLIPPSPVISARPSKESSSLRRLRPLSQYPYSPISAESPRSPFTVRPPYCPADRRARSIDTTNASSGRIITIQHIVTRTVTLKRTPALEAPPKGKRRRTSDSEEQ